MIRTISLLFLICLLLIACQEDLMPGENMDENVIPGRYQNAVFTQIDSFPDLQYGTAPDGESLLLDMYFPKNDTATHTRPMIVFVHGGAFYEGDRKEFGNKAIVEHFAFLGYVTASISYRLLDEEYYSLEDLALEKVNFDNPEIDMLPIMNAVHDTRAAIRYLKKNATEYNIDPDRIAIGGGSAGGITSGIVGYMNDDSELFDGAQPPTIEGASGHPEFDSKVKTVYCLCSGLINLDLVDGSDDPPMFMQQNSSDTLITGNRIPEFEMHANDVGLPHATLQQGGFHCHWSIPFLGLVDLIQLREQLRDFFYEHLVPQ